MIDVPTLFILGAGASVPYRYPTGAELRKRIVQNFHSSIENLTRKDPKLSRSEKEQEVQEAANLIRIFEKSSVVSIDKFLSLNPTLQRYGKIAITWAILTSEQNSVL